MRKIGLTGGIGSGKSTVAAMLVAQGLPLIDADGLSRAATQVGGLAIPEIRRAFGDGMIALDGSLNRDAMRQAMLIDANVKARLEGILHPLIGQQIDLELKLAHEAGAQIAVLDIPLLVEGGSRWRSRVDAVWVVDCSQARSGWPETQIEAVMAAQASRVQRLAAADAVIFNEGISLPELEQRVLTLLKSFKLSAHG
jgi:dephospho-CoA kinase